MLFLLYVKPNQINYNGSHMEDKLPYTIRFFLYSELYDRKVKKRCLLDRVSLECGYWNRSTRGTRVVT